mmetsp:Transcript_16318/g.45473  ORF Transcript_16318/g.45473 Transcript_16318/m.45473 type:complete len:894 (-) Transcript_16318:152-2833(-)
MTASQAGLRSGRRSFPSFPHKLPYLVQSDFMEHLYSVLQAGGVGLFESPTGTGKTLSLICSTLQWLEDRLCEEELNEALGGGGEEGDKKGEGSHTGGGEDEDGEPDWLLDWQQPPPGGAAATPSLSQRKPPPRRTAKPLAKDLHVDQDAEFLLNDWAEESAGKRKAKASSDSSSCESEGPRQEVYDPLQVDESARPHRQVIFCSRTHSQLTQFIGELRRTPFAASLSVVTLASRKALCINKDVTKLGSASRINERCLDMQGSKPRTKPKTTAAGSSKRGKRLSRCAYCVAKPEEHQTVRDAVLGTPLDVEDLGKLGQKLSICPYYATRRAQAAADVLLMPYSALLSKEARESLGVKIEGSVIVVDEAHNLVDAVNSLHSATLSEGDLEAVVSQLGAYEQRFRSRLGPGNLCNLDTLLSVAGRLRDALAPSPAASRSGHEPGSCNSTWSTTVLGINQFLLEHGLDNINLFRLLEYMKENKVVSKVSGYAEKEAAENSGQVAAPAEVEQEQARGQTAALHGLVSFLTALTNCDSEGRIIVERRQPSHGLPEGHLKFVLLTAASHFSQIVSSAHAVVLASGTLSPVDSLIQQLFPSVDPGRLHRFSCGHVVPPSQLLALPLGVGPGGAPLDLRHSCRSKPSTIDQVGMMLSNLCGIVPEGMVVFFPSFRYMAEVKARLESTGMLRTINSKKQVFVESRSAGSVDSLLSAFSAACESQAGAEGQGSSRAVGGTGSGGGRVDRQPRGAILLSVVGGKMSEGINFGDGLGRCVVMAGMPYPNGADPELKERMSHLDRAAATQRTQGGRHLDSLDGRSYYEDLCMKAVNQCIGRVIRHAGDYAVIVLADQRYAAAVRDGKCRGPLAKLPKWIQASVIDGPSNFGAAMMSVKGFFRRQAHA